MAHKLQSISDQLQRKEMFYALNTFYLRLYGVRHIVKDHSDRVLLYASSHRQDVHTMAFVTPVVEHWLKREIAQWATIKD